MSAAHLAGVVLWSAATIAAYQLGVRIHARAPRWWSAPIIVATVVLAGVLAVCGVPYREYASGAGWLTTMLGPATVAFAVPIYEQRALVGRHWRVLVVGGVAGTVTAVVSSWGLATLVGLDGVVRLSLVPRSTSTPFAMVVSERIGGVPELTAVFVVTTGVLGAILGQWLLAPLRVRSALARGTLFGVGAHGVGTAQAYAIGHTEGAVASLVMVSVGVLSVVSAPLLAELLP